MTERHRFVGSIIWPSTYAKAMESAVARQLLNGWTVSSIITAATGQPYSAMIGTSILGTAIPGDDGMTGAEVSTFAGPAAVFPGWGEISTICLTSPH